MGGWRQVRNGVGRMGKRVVLTVSGLIPADIHEQIASGRRPRADYLELARSFDAELLDYASARTATGLIGRMLSRIGGPNLTMAYACWKARGKLEAIVTDGEQIGLPLALLLKFSPGRRPRHMMIVHVLSEPKKTVFLDWLGVQRCIDRFITYCSWQHQFIMRRWNLPASRVVRTPFMVDHHFFAPGRVQPALPARRQICAVGLERRDYVTLLRAVEGLDVHVVIAAASPWSKRGDGMAGERIPDNVTVKKFTQYELRQLYADSRFMVMPLEPVNFQAGVTAILECMAMGKAVVCTRVPGQTDVVIDGETGRYVPPRDPAALRKEIERLLDHPEEADRWGARGRQLIEEEMNLDRYSQRLSALLREMLREVQPA